MSTQEPHAPTISYITVGTQKLRAAIWHGNSDKLPLLFFNGIGANLEIAQPLAEAMQDRTLITFDMPGIGGSPDPVMPYRPWWVALAAKKIIRHYGFNKVDVLGVSWGGGPAQQFAFQYQKLTNRLILAATSPGVTMVPGNIQALMKMSSPKRYVDRNYLAQHFQTLYGDDVDGAPKFSSRMTPPTIKGYLFQLSAMMGWSSLPLLPFLPHQTLVISGDRDQVVPLANAKILKFFIPNSKLYVVEDAGHLFMLSKTEEFLNVLGEFLDEQTEETNLASAAA